MVSKRYKSRCSRTKKMSKCTRSRGCRAVGPFMKMGKNGSYAISYCRSNTATGAIKKNKSVARNRRQRSKARRMQRAAMGGAFMRRSSFSY